MIANGGSLFFFFKVTVNQQLSGVQIDWYRQAGRLQGHMGYTQPKTLEDSVLYLAYRIVIFFFFIFLLFNSSPTTSNPPFLGKLAKKGSFPGEGGGGGRL